jgi:hypothetical protein
MLGLRARRASIVIASRWRAHRSVESREHDHAKHRCNRNVSRFRGGDSPHCVRKFRLSGQALPGRFRLRSAQNLHPMAERIGDLRVAGREPGDASVASD